MEQEIAIHKFGNLVVTVNPAQIEEKKNACQLLLTLCEVFEISMLPFLESIVSAITPILKSKHESNFKETIVQLSSKCVMILHQGLIKSNTNNTQPLKALIHEFIPPLIAIIDTDENLDGIINAIKSLIEVCMCVCIFIILFLYFN